MLLVVFVAMALNAGCQKPNTQYYLGKKIRGQKILENKEALQVLREKYHVTEVTLFSQNTAGITYSTKIEGLELFEGLYSATLTCNPTSIEPEAKATIFLSSLSAVDELNKEKYVPSDPIYKGWVEKCDSMAKLIMNDPEIFK